MSDKRKKMKAKLDSLFSVYIRLRGHNTCFICGAKRETAVMQCGHLITRARESTRWDEKNAECSCSGCNLKHEYNPEIFTLIYIKRYGQAQYEEIVKKSWEKKKFSIFDFDKMIEYYKNEIDKIK